MFKTTQICGLFFLIFLAVVAIISIFYIPRAFTENDKITFSTFVKGQWAKGLETKLDKSLPHFQPSVDSWTTLGYVMFKEGKKGVLVGKDGWLFTDEEFANPKDYAKNIKTNIQYIKDVHNALEKRDIRLLVVPVPAKARIYSEYLGSYTYPSYWQRRYSDFLEALGSNNIAFANTLAAFTRFRRQNEGEPNLFLKSDTHWNPIGARRTAVIAAQEANRIWPYMSFEEKKFVTDVTGQQTHEGDLMRYVSMGDNMEKFGLSPDTIKVHKTSEVAEPSAEIGEQSDALFADESFPVVLVGTSYSANSLWNFEGFLKEAFSADVLNMADEGQGPFTTMQAYLKSEEYKSQSPKLVVWEIPERYIVNHYELEKIL